MSKESKRDLRRFLVGELTMALWRAERRYPVVSTLLRAIRAARLLERRGRR